MIHRTTQYSCKAHMMNSALSLMPTFVRGPHMLAYTMDQKHTTRNEITNDMEHPN